MALLDRDAQGLEQTADEAVAGGEPRVDGGRQVPQRVRSALTAGESRWLADQPDASDAFLRLWVRKEALVKPGLGRLGELHRLDALRPPPAATVVDWSGTGAVGACALAGPAAGAETSTG